LISVIIPVKNGEATLVKCLQSIQEQTGVQSQIIVLDSESTDNSRQIAEQFGAEVITIPANSFNHGLTRNIGVVHALGDLLFFTVQDAWLSEKDSLYRMANHFKDQEVMGVGGHQAVAKSHDTNPMIWFRRYSAVRVVERKFTLEQINQMSSQVKKENVSWDNVIAMYRKKALEALPFVRTDFAEDCVWCYQALQKGWKLIYDTSLVTYHYHHAGFSYSFRLAYTINYHFLIFFSLLPPLPSWFKKCLQVVYHISKNKELNVKEKLYWTWHNLSGTTGSFLSHLHFLMKYKIAGYEGVKESYNHFCKTVPQGKIRKS
jgi:rhamnosyltransferase